MLPKKVNASQLLLIGIVLYWATNSSIGALDYLDQYDQVERFGGSSARTFGCSCDCEKRARIFYEPCPGSEEEKNFITMKLKRIKSALGCVFKFRYLVRAKELGIEIPKICCYVQKTKELCEKNPKEPTPQPDSTPKPDQRPDLNTDYESHSAELAGYGYAEDEE